MHENTYMTLKTIYRWFIFTSLYLTTYVKHHEILFIYVLVQIRQLLCSLYGAAQIIPTRYQIQLMRTVPQKYCSTTTDVRHHVNWL